MKRNFFYALMIQIVIILQLLFYVQLFSTYKKLMVSVT